MPVHNWTRISAGTFHDFHYSWVLEIKRALKRGLLSKGYYVMAEQVGGDFGAPDVLALQASGAKPDSEAPLTGTAPLTETPPLVHSRTNIARDLYTTAAAYVGGTVVDAFVAHFAVGEAIPPMPLFLTRENYVYIPLEESYRVAWEDVPPQYQERLLASS